jgi:glycerophosphoryl diester phosphodiesterase
MTMRLYLLPLLVLLAGCATRQTLLESPPLQDEVPQIETGYYKAYGGQGEGMSEDREVGALYLYRDEFLEGGVRFMGIRGVYFPEGMIWTQWKDGKPWIVGMPDPDGDHWAEMDFTSEGEGLWGVGIRRDNGDRDTLLLKFTGRRGGGDTARTVFIAHRGTAYQPPHYVGGIYPANTLPAFEAALRSGYDGFELDVRVTKDLRWVISHDEDLGVTTLSSGLVKEKTLAEARQCTVVASTTIPEVASSAIDAPLASRLPALEEVLERFLPDPRLRLILVDVKPDSEERIRAAAKADFDGMTEEHQRKIMFLVRTEETARVLRELVPHSGIALEGSMGLEPVKEPERFIPELAERPREAHDAVSFGAGWWLRPGASGVVRLDALEEFNSICHEYGYSLICWTVSDKSRLDMIRERRFRPDVWISDAPMYLLAGEGLYIYEEERTR